MPGLNYWHSGMLLSPIVFEHHDLSLDRQIRQLLQLYAPYYWGVKTVVINEAALQHFHFEVEQCEVVTREGSVLRVCVDAQSNARLEPRSFAQELDSDGRPLPVYLAIRRLRLDECNVRHPVGAQVRLHQGQDRRYLVDETECRDVYAEGDATAVVRRLLYNARVLFGEREAAAGDDELVQIAEVVRASDGKGGILSPTTIPPCLAVRSSPVLLAIMKEVRDLLTAKGYELACNGRAGGGGAVTLRTLDLRDHLMAQTLNRYTPLFHDMVEQGYLPPAAAYTLLRQLVGELATFSETTSVLGQWNGEELLPSYQHEQSGLCFNAAVRRIRVLLSELKGSPLGEIVLTHDGECFSAPFLPAPFFTRKQLYCIAIRTDLTLEQIETLLPTRWKVASLQDMPEIRLCSLRGVPLTTMSMLPEELRRRAHYRYLAIDVHASHWQNVEREQSIAAYFPEIPRDTDVRLLAIPAEKETV